MSQDTVTIHHYANGGGSSSIDIPCELFGEWAVHEEKPTPINGWGCSHAPSGHSVGSFHCREIAVEYAKELEKKMPPLDLTEEQLSRATKGPLSTHDFPDGYTVAISSFCDLYEEKDEAVFEEYFDEYGG